MGALSLSRIGARNCLPLPLIQSYRSRRMLAEHHAVERSEMQGLTYGEVDILSFVKMLRLAGARDNQVFVDLVSYTSFSLLTASRDAELGKLSSPRHSQELNSCDALV
jgi:hypothetical protein